MAAGDLFELTCPLPLYFHRWIDAADDYVDGWEACGEPLHVEALRSDLLTAQGTYEGNEAGDYWKVVCENGHVLVVPECDGDSVDPPDPIVLAKILKEMGVADVHPLLNPEQGPRCPRCERWSLESASRPGDFVCPTPKCELHGKTVAIAKGATDGPA